MAVVHNQSHRPGFSPLLALLAPILGLLVYLTVLNNPLLVPERRLTVENPQVAKPAAAAVIWLAPTPLDDPAHFAYRPVEVALWRAQYNAWGDSPSSFHSVNLILFVAIIIVFWLLTGRLTAHPLARLAAVMILALHPMATQSVQSVAGQGNLLALLASLLACTVLQHYRAQRLGLGWTAGAIALLTTLAVGSAELGLLLSVWLLAVAGLTQPTPVAPVESGPRRKKRTAVVAESATTPVRANWLRWAALGLPVLAIVAGYLYLRWRALGGWAPAVGTAVSPGLDGLPVAPFTAPAIVMLYLKRLLWPVSPTLIYSPVYEPHLLPPLAVGWIVLLALVALTVWACRQRSLMGLGLIMLLTPLLALSHWIHLPFFMSEEPLVFALPGLGLVVGTLVARLAPLTATGGTIWRARSVLTVLCAVWLLMAWQTWARGRDWKSAEVLWEAEARLHPQCARPLVELLDIYSRGQNVEAARHTAEQAHKLARLDDLDRIAELEAALASVQKDDGRLQQILNAELASQPSHARGHFTKLAYFARQRQMATLAEGLLRRELAGNPDAFEALYDLSDMALQRKDMAEAITLGGKAASVASPAVRAKAFAQFGTILSEAGRFDEALFQYRQALNTDPTLYLPYINMARIYWGRGDYVNAELAIQSAAVNVNLLSFGDLAQLYTGVLESQHKIKEALDWINGMVAQRPDDVPLHLFAALFLIQYQQYDKALALYQPLIKPLQAAHDIQLADVLTGLGLIARDQAKNPTQAAEYWRQALQINPSQAQAIQLLNQYNNSQRKQIAKPPTSAPMSVPVVATPNVASTPSVTVMGQAATSTQSQVSLGGDHSTPTPTSGTAPVATPVTVTTATTATAANATVTTTTAVATPAPAATATPTPAPTASPVPTAVVVPVTTASTATSTTQPATPHP